MSRRMPWSTLSKTSLSPRPGFTGSGAYRYCFRSCRMLGAGFAVLPVIPSGPLRLPLRSSRPSCWFHPTWPAGVAVPCRGKFRPGVAAQARPQLVWRPPFIPRVYGFVTSYGEHEPQVTTAYGRPSLVVLHALVLPANPRAPAFLRPAAGASPVRRIIGC